MRALVVLGLVLTLDQARVRLKLADLGWDNSVSTTTWFASFSAYYDELAHAR